MLDSEQKNKTKRFMTHLVSNQGSIRSFITCSVPNRSDVDDLLQETLSEMWLKFDQFAEGTCFIAWGITIAKYKILSYRKKHSKSKLQFTSETLEIIQSEAGLIGDHDFLDNQTDILRKCVEKLSTKEKKYLRLRYEDNLTFQGIADRVGITMQGIYSGFTLIHSRLLKCVRLKMKLEGIV